MSIIIRRSGVVGQHKLVWLFQIKSSAGVISSIHYCFLIVFVIKIHVINLVSEESQYKINLHIFNFTLMLYIHI